MKKNIAIMLIFVVCLQLFSGFCVYSATTEINFSTAMTSVAYGSEADVFVACGKNAALYVSEDATTWNRISNSSIFDGYGNVAAISNKADALGNVTYLDGEIGSFVTTSGNSANGDTYLLRSADGLKWYKVDNRAADKYIKIFSVCYLDGTLWGTGDLEDGTATIYKAEMTGNEFNSASQINWIKVDTGISDATKAFNKFVTNGDNKIFAYTSPHGTRGANGAWNQNGNVVMSSDKGETWQPVNMSQNNFNQILNSVMYDPYSKKFFASGSLGNQYIINTDVGQSIGVSKGAQTYFIASTDKTYYIAYENSGSVAKLYSAPRKGTSISILTSESGLLTDVLGNSQSGYNWSTDGAKLSWAVKQKADGAGNIFVGADNTKNNILRIETNNSGDTQTVSCSVIKKYEQYETSAMNILTNSLVIPKGASSTEFGLVVGYFDGNGFGTTETWPVSWKCTSIPDGMYWDMGTATMVADSTIPNGTEFEVQAESGIYTATKIITVKNQNILTNVYEKDENSGLYTKPLSEITAGKTVLASSSWNHADGDAVPTVAEIVVLNDKKSNRLIAAKSGMLTDLKTGQDCTLEVEFTVPDDIDAEGDYEISVFVLNGYDTVGPLSQKLSFPVEEQIVPYMYAMDYAPHFESDNEVAARESFLFGLWERFFDEVDSYVAREDYAGLYNLIGGEKCITLAKEYGYTELLEPTVQKMTEEIFGQITFAEERLYETAAKMAPDDNRLPLFRPGQETFIGDLDTVDPIREFLRTALALKKAGAYTGEVKKEVERFIEKHVEDRWPLTMATGYYYTTCYNKEIYSMDITSLVTALYEDEPDKYPYTKRNFYEFWRALMEQAYDVDNSPHYDPESNLKLILDMADRHGLVDQLKIRPDVQRVATRMAQTILSNGEIAQWGKSMWNFDATTQRYICLGTEWLSWCLYRCYQIFDDEFLLYAGRKFAQYSLNYSGLNRYYDWVFLEPDGINCFDKTNVNASSEQLTSVATIRLTSPSRGYGMLQRNPAPNDVVEAEDKLILSTGFSSKSPYLMIDLSRSGSKAQGDHRIGINNLMFDGAHMGSYFGRLSPAPTKNRIFISPDIYRYPFIDGIIDENTTIDGAGTALDGPYFSLMTNDSGTGYTLEGYHATQLSEDVAYGVVEYSQLQYHGVHAKREICLLNNGVTIINDTTWTDDAYEGNMNAGSIYHLWSRIIQSSDNWWVQAGRPSVYADTLNKDYDHYVKSLFYFAEIEGNEIGVAQNNVCVEGNNIIYSYQPLEKGETVSNVMVIVPFEEKTQNRTVEDVANNITLVTDDGVTEVSIPYDRSGNKMVVTFFPDSDAEYYFGK